MDNNYSFLDDIITFVCSVKCPPDRHVQDFNDEDIILEDYPYELFSVTYSRLNRQEDKEWGRKHLLSAFAQLL